MSKHFGDCEGRKPSFWPQQTLSVPVLIRPLWTCSALVETRGRVDSVVQLKYVPFYWCRLILAHIQITQSTAPSSQNDGELIRRWGNGEKAPAGPSSCQCIVLLINCLLWHKKQQRFFSFLNFWNCCSLSFLGPGSSGSRSDLCSVELGFLMSRWWMQHRT